MANDYFLKIDGIDGESTDIQFPKWIEILSWDWGATNKAARDNGKVSIDELSLSARLSAASLSISQYCVTGKHINWTELDCLSPADSPQIYLKIKLTDVIVSSDKITAGNDDEHPIEKFTLNFGKVELQYGAQDDMGKVSSLDKKMSFDMRTNRIA